MVSQPKLNRGAQQASIGNSRLQPSKKRLAHLARPFESIPVEILIDILLLACPPKWAFRQSGMSSSPILSVCRQWREIMLNVPEFWSRIDVASQRSIYVSKDKLRISMALWLDRAQKTALDITSDINTDSNVWKLLLERVSQWRSWNVRVAHRIQPIWTSLMPLYTAHNLRKLAICDFDRDHPNVYFPISEPAPRDLELPQLQILDFTSVGKLTHLLSAIFAPRLIKLIVHETHPIALDVPLISVKFPLLKVLQLDHVTLPTSFADVKFTCLEVLTCDFNHWSQLLPLCPRLRSLHLHTRTHMGRVVDPKGSYPAITSLNLIGNFEANMIKKFISMLPSVRRLVLERFEQCNSLIKLLSHTASHPVLPHLEDLTLRHVPVSLPLLVSFSESRTSRKRWRTSCNHCSAIYLPQVAQCRITLSTCREVGKNYWTRNIRNVKNADLLAMRIHSALLQVNPSAHLREKPPWR